MCIALHNTTDTNKVRYKYKECNDFKSDEIEGFFPALKNVYIIMIFITYSMT